MKTSRCAPTRPFVLFSATAALLVCSSLASQARQRPNVVVILADDLGYGDVRAYRPESKIPTPHLDALAKTGLRFTDAHAPSAVCTPTRYALLTGRYCWRSRLKRGVLFPPKDAPLIERDRPTLGTLFAKHGYRTACIGKWHLGIEWARKPGGAVDFDAPFREGPTTRGFDEFFGIAASLDMVPYAYLEQDRPTAPMTSEQAKLRFPRFIRKGPRAKDFAPEEVLDRLTERAAAFVAARAEQDAPFFLYLPLTAPHKPVWPAKRFRGKSGLGPYGDFVMQVDDSVGRVLGAIEAAGVRDETVVVFTSDNGSFMRRKGAKEAGHVDDVRVQGFRRDRHQSNHVWRGTKADIYEGGHRVPFVVRWPGRTRKATRCDATLCHVDLFATFAEMLGHRCAPDEAPDSCSFLALLSKIDAPHARPPVVHHSAGGTFAVREGRYKLILGNGSGGRQNPRGAPFREPFQLYDLEADPGERRNIAAQHAARVSRLTQLVRALQAGAPSVQRAEGELDNVPASTVWNRFRGPNGSGVADGYALPDEVGPEKNCAWKRAVPPGHSSPVVWGDRIYLTGIDAAASEGGERLVTLCMDLGSGETLWRREAPRPRTERFDKRNNAASPTPCCDARGVVVFFPDFGLVAYDPEGREQWRHALGPFDNIYGMGASPVLHGDRVFLPCDQQSASFLLALARADGKELWRKARPHALSGHCTPIFYPRADDPSARLILPGSFYLDAYDPASGDRKWYVGGLACEMKSTPVIDRDRILINGYASPLNQVGNQIDVPKFETALKRFDADGSETITEKEMPRTRARMYFSFVDLDKDAALDAEEWSTLRAALASQNGMLAIRAGGEGDCTETHLVWAQRRSVPQLPSPLLYRGRIYLLGDQGGLISLLDPKSGKRRLRGRLPNAQDSYYASPVAGDGKVYFVSQSGILSVVRAGEKLDVLGSCELDEACYATPAIVGGRLLVRTTMQLYCFATR